MTLKWKDLELFMGHLRRLGFESEVSDDILEREIAKQFGISSYTIKNVKRALTKYGFIKPVSIGVWKIIQKAGFSQVEVSGEDLKKYDELIEDGSDRH